MFGQTTTPILDQTKATSEVVEAPAARIRADAVKAVEEEYA